MARTTKPKATTKAAPKVIDELEPGMLVIRDEADGRTRTVPNAVYVQLHKEVIHKGGRSKPVPRYTVLKGTPTLPREGK